MILTRELVRPHLAAVTVAPITTTIRGLSTEVHVDTANGLTGSSVVSCEDITTIPTSALGAQISVIRSQSRLRPFGGAPCPVRGFG